MNLQTQSVTTALALYPLHFLQWVTPVLPAGTAHGGLPQSAFTPQGVEVVIEPFTGLQNWTMAAYDVAGIYVNGVFTGVTKTIFPGEENDRFLLHIPASWFVNGINNVFYRVKRLSGNSEDSIALDVLYHAPVAGITTSHPATVDPGQPGSVTINISYARPYDTVTLTIGTWSITFNNPDPTKPITHTLTAAELQQIGDGTHPVSARVRDQLTNSNVSATSSIVISTNQPLIIPKLISVLDATGNDVTEGSTTSSTSLTLHGEASPGRQVEIYDGSGPSAVPKGTVTANPTTGKWELSITVPSGARRLYAKSLYHPTNTYSNVRNLTVTPRLTIDNSLMLLTGNRIIQDYGWPQREIGTSIRTATGGAPPFDYISSDSSIVSVTRSGKVTAHKPGVVKIKVTDKNNDSAFYSIDSQVMTFRHLVNNSPLTPSEARAWISDAGGMVASEFNRLNLQGILEENYTNILTIFDNTSGVSTGRYILHNDVEAGGVYILHFSLLPSLVLGSANFYYSQNDRYKAFALVRV